jgi:transcription factor IIIB subunit 2
MARFADKLDFGADTGRVVQQANRVAQSMSRDWMVTGRRPAGICAAALFISARLNGYNRTIREIVMVVKICENTLRSRLQEFTETAAANLPTTVFQTTIINSSEDPPALKKRKRNPKLVESEAGPVSPNAPVDPEEEQLLNEATQYVTEAEHRELFQVGESLSDLDDDPEVVNCLAMSDDEAEFKRELWMEENADWVLKQQSQPKQTAKKEPKKVPWCLT